MYDLTRFYVLFIGILSSPKNKEHFKTRLMNPANDVSPLTKYLLQSNMAKTKRFE